MSIASSELAYQVGQVILVDSDLAAKWRAGGHCEFVNGTTALTDFFALDGLQDLTQEEALRRHCIHCQRRAQFVFGNQPYCARHYRAECGS